MQAVRPVPFGDDMADRIGQIGNGADRIGHGEVSGIRARAQHGLRRTLLSNCVVGVSKGFDKVLEVVGVGYKVAVKGNVVELALGFSHPVLVDLPKGVSAKAEGMKLTLSSADKELLGEVAAGIRRLRKPEPYN